jgi:hypothetical protein
VRSPCGYLGTAQRCKRIAHAEYNKDKPRSVLFGVPQPLAAVVFEDVAVNALF